MNNFDNKLDRRGKPTRASNYEVVYFKVACSFTHLIAHKVPQKHTVKVVFDPTTLTMKKIEAQCEHRKDFAFLQDLNPDADSCVAFADAMKTMTMARPEKFDGTPASTRATQVLAKYKTVNSFWSPDVLCSASRNMSRKLVVSERQKEPAPSIAIGPEAVKVALLNRSIRTFIQKSLPLVSVEDSSRKFAPGEASDHERLHIKFRPGTALTDGQYILVKDAYSSQPLAYYDKGVWVLNESNLFSAFGEHVHPLHYRVRDLHAIPKEVGVPCFFCGKSFPQINKHLEGGVHKTALKQWFSLLLKAHSTAGLRMLNNPKYKHIFFPKLAK